MPSQQLQERNSEMVRLLAGDFQLRYEPNFAWCNALAALKALPGIRGVWPMSAFDSSGNCVDVSGNGKLLTYHSGVYNYSSLIPYIDLNGQADYLSRADEADLDILGTETFVAGAANGLTLGGWFNFDNVAQNGVGLMGKWDAGTNNRSYLLEHVVVAGNSRCKFHISTNGIADSAFTFPARAVVAQTWTFVAAAYKPSGTSYGYVDADWSGSGPAPASIFNGAANFEIGAYNGAANFYAGLASLCFLSSCYLSPTIISSIYQQTRALFGA